MKKFFFAVLVAGSLAACNNSGDTTTNPDSATADSMNVVPAAPMPDSATMMPADSTHNMMTDSSTMKMDSTKKM